MSEQASYSKYERTGPETIVPIVVAIVIYALVGAAAGIMMARISPSDKFSWAGLAIAPIWLLLEVVFEILIAIFGAYARVARLLVTLALLLSFYIAWFAMRIF